MRIEIWMKKIRIETKPTIKQMNVCDRKYYKKKSNDCESNENSHESN